MTTPALLTDGELRAVRERVERATPGPWDYHGYTTSYHIAQILNGHYHASPRVVHATLGKSVFNQDDPEIGAGGVRMMVDAEFIAHARTDIPALLAHISALTAQLEQVNERLIAFEADDTIPNMMEAMRNLNNTLETEQATNDYLRKRELELEAQLQQVSGERDRLRFMVNNGLTDEDLNESAEAMREIKAHMHD
jgi:hypothetical protein